MLDQTSIAKNQKVTAAGAGAPGMTALQVAGGGGRPWAVARLGREEGLEVNSHGWDGLTPLTSAAANGITPVSPLPLYLPQAAWAVSGSWSSCQPARSTLWTAGETLICAVQWPGELECGRELLGVLGININLKWKDGKTATLTRGCLKVHG